MNTFTLIKDNHLGGFIKGGDPRTYYPQLWDKIIMDYKVETMFDVGCGEGYAVEYFQNKGIQASGVDGSKKVLKNKVINNLEIHDYTKGSFTINIFYKRRYVDLIWCCEFVEHVEEEYINNFLETFKCGKIVILTHALPGQGGYHHVNEQNDIYWIDKMEKTGFEFDAVKTMEYRKLAHDYFEKTGMVFINKKYNDGTKKR